MNDEQKKFKTWRSSLQFIFIKKLSFAMMYEIWIGVLLTFMKIK